MLNQTEQNISFDQRNDLWETRTVGDFPVKPGVNVLTVQCIRPLSGEDPNRYSKLRDDLIVRTPERLQMTGVSHVEITVLEPAGED